MSDIVIRLAANTPGCRPMLSADQRRALAGMVEAGPIPAVHGVVRWRLIDLAQWVWDEFALSISKQTLSRELRALGYAVNGLNQYTTAGPATFTYDANGNLVSDGSTFDLRPM